MVVGGDGNSVTQIISQSPHLPSAGLETSLWDQGASLPWLNLRTNAQLQEEGRGRGEQGLGRHGRKCRMQNKFLPAGNSYFSVRLCPRAGEQGGKKRTR